LPSFTIHSLAGGLRLSATGRVEHSVAVAIDNLTDELYAEFSNATFFRPQPGRSLTASYRLRF
jgi:outer membrane receptor protein involved in Fe transport